MSHERIVNGTEVDKVVPFFAGCKQVGHGSQCDIYHCNTSVRNGTGRYNAHVSSFAKMVSEHLKREQQIGSSHFELGCHARRLNRLKIRGNSSELSFGFPNQVKPLKNAAQQHFQMLDSSKPGAHQPRHPRPDEVRECYFRAKEED